MYYYYPKSTKFHPMSKETWGKILLIRAIKNGKMPAKKKEMLSTNREEIIAQAKQVVDAYKKEKMEKHQ